MQQGPLVDIRNTCLRRGSGGHRAQRSSLRVPFEKIGKEILPPQFQLSLVLCGDFLSRKMNRSYRKKNYPANVLSFPYGKNEGEIFINMAKAAREAKKYGIPPRDRIAHLFIHGCLHLLSWKHGSRMDARENRILKKFSFQTIVP